MKSEDKESGKFERKIPPHVHFSNHRVGAQDTGTCKGCRMQAHAGCTCRVKLDAKRVPPRNCYLFLKLI